MYKQKGFTTLETIILFFVLYCMGLGSIYFFNKQKTDQATTFLPILESSFNSAVPQLKITVENKNKQKVGDLKLNCDLTMKSGSEGSVETVIFESIQTNEIKTFNVSNLQYGDFGKNLPMSNIQNISSCRIVGFKEIK